MFYISLALAAFFLLLLVLPKSNAAQPFESGPLPRHICGAQRRTHFIDAHLHRDDEKKFRHKQNQYPL